MLEITLLMIISFSPLFSNYINAVLILIMVALNIKRIRTIEKRQGLVLLLILSLFFIGMIFDLRNVNSIVEISILNVYFPLCFLLGFLISGKYKLDEYLYYIEKVVFVVVIFSLIGVFIYSNFPSFIYKLPTYSFYHSSHKTAIIFNVLINESGIVYRNAGIAWEPGAFQLLINLGVYAYIRNMNKVSFLKIGIYGLAIFFTKSTAGIFIFIFIIFYILRRDKIARWFIIISILIFLDVIRQELLYQYNYKLLGSYSFEIRLEPMLKVYKVGREYFWGLGNSGYNSLYTSVGLGAFDSFAQIFIRYGYPLLALIIFLLVKLLTNFRMLFLILFFTFISQTIWFFPLITPFYFMSVKKLDFQEKV